MRSQSDDPRRIAQLRSAPRRQFLGYGGTLLGASIIAPFYPRLADAQTTGFDYYISATGDDHNPGTLSRPWTFNAINTRKATYAGKNIGVLPGTYSMLTIAGGYSTTSMFVPQFRIAGGSRGSPTILASCDNSGNYSPRTAILDAQATPGNNAAGVPALGTFGAHESAPYGDGYVTIDGFEIRNAYYNAICVGYVNGAGQPPKRQLGIVVQNNYIHAMTNSIAAENACGVTVMACDGALIRNNLITDISDTTRRAVGIDIWTSINCVTEFNSVISTNGGMNGGIFHKNAAQWNNTIRFNFIDLSAAGTSENGMDGGICIDQDDSHGVQTDAIHGNVVLSGTRPLRACVIAVGDYPNWRCRFDVYNNTFLGIPDCATGMVAHYSAPGTLKFWNNIIKRGSVGYGTDADFNVSNLALADYNLYPASPGMILTPNGSGSTGSGSQARSLPAWRSLLASSNASCVGKEAHSLAATPVFASAGAGASRYQLAAGSAGKGAGRADGTAPGTATDMGAWGNGTTQVGCNFGAG